MSRDTMTYNNADLEKQASELSGLRGQDYWRSLEELAGTEEFQQFLQAEFPNAVEEVSDPTGRRRFLKLMGASMALAGAGSACVKQPREKIVPYVKQPEDLIPGRPKYYATAVTHSGYARGVLVESHEYRPTKIEGNPQHPASLGGTDAFTQAAVLDLYDPDRSRHVLKAGLPSTWENFRAEWNEKLNSTLGGEGVRLLTGTLTSPSVHAKIKQFLEDYPNAKWHQWEPVNEDNAIDGAKLAYGEPVNTYYRFDRAQTILALDSDFLHDHAASVRYARDYSSVRQGWTEGKRGGRLYAVESTYTITGGQADHRLALKARDVEGFTRALAVAVGVKDVAGASVMEGERAAWFNALVSDLKASRGASIVVPGAHQPPIVHALAHAINEALGNIGETVVHTEPAIAEPTNQQASIQTLVEEMRSGAVKTIVFLETNPVFDAPADLDFVAALEQVPFRVHFGQRDDETAHYCHWHLPASHALESWGDARAYDGTVTLIQPLIQPLFESKPTLEFLAMLDGSGSKGHDLLKSYWKGALDAPDFERRWRRALHDGILPGTELAEKTPQLKSGLGKTEPQTSNGLEVVFRPDPTIWDGRYANNGWLQELPKPVTKLTWDNALLVSTQTASKLGVETHQVARIELDGRSVEGSVWVVPGHPNDTITVHLGYGRERAGQVGNGAGFNAFAIRSAKSGLHVAANAKFTATGRRAELVSTQHTHSIHGRHLVRSAPLDLFEKEPNFVEHYEHGPRGSLYAPIAYDGDYSWGMTIDLNSCMGCNACTIACQAENNISVVGKDEVAKGREMHWIRVDRYFKGEPEDPEMVHQPVTCMHCENAPCEPVCPVNATVHGPEGLNQMVYNRCVGTRYCSNNCPYKVRRFNFTLYTDWNTDTYKLQRNPDVTPRSRGVMEKCTYCVQRINSARIEARKEGRTIKDGEVVTACQGACPTQAITFGNLNDPDSAINKAKQSPRNYGLLEQIGTRPRTTYLARLTNPNPDLAPKSHKDDDTEHH